MDPGLFEELTRSIRQAGAIARGERKPSRRHEFTPSRIQAVREGSGLSQAQFARLLNVSVKTLQNWGQARRQRRVVAKPLRWQAARRDCGSGRLRDRLREVAHLGRVRGRNGSHT